jgi:RNA polymerase sigma factor (sigma-70 family)
VAVALLSPTAAHAPNGWPQALLRGFRAGERAALAEVYRGHAEQVALYLRRGFSFRAGADVHRFVGYGGASDLHDVLQETFRRAFEPAARARYDGLRPYAPYLKAIARNLVLQGFRRQRTRFPRLGELDDVDAEELEVDGPVPHDPERELQDRQVQRLVQAFLALLAPDERELLRLRFSEGLSQRDVAARLGLGRQLVRTREARLRERLLEYLVARGEGGLASGAGLTLLALAETWLAEALR